jgi:catechol 2,3-dioxygenase-like lactoylglutathione lyase family enzyme
VRATRFNHVSVRADDLERSGAFYEELFGMERVPAPDLGETRVLWLRLGDQQLHLFRRETDTPRYHHYALEVDDFEAVYRAAQERGILDAETFGAALRELPDGSVQMYLRDPAGNLIEVDWPDAATLDGSITTDLVRLADVIRQEPGAERASLFVR